MARKEQFSDDEKRQILNQATTFWEQSTEAMRSFFQLVTQYERAYRVMLPKELEQKYAEKPDRACLVPADIHINVNSMSSRVRTTIFREKPYFRLSIEGQPAKRADSVEKAEKLVQSMMDVSSDGRGFEHEATKATNQAIYAGRSVVAHHWVKKRARKLVRDVEGMPKFDKDGAPMFKLETVSEYAETFNIDIRRMRFDPSADSVRDMRLVGFEKTMNLSELLIENADPESFVKFDAEKLARSSFNYTKYYEFVEGEKATHTNQGRENEDYGDKIVQVWEIRGLFRFKQPNGVPKFEDLVVLIGNENELIGVKRNDSPLDGWEHFDYPAVAVDHDRLYPLGLVEPGFDTWIELHLHRNLAIDQAVRNTLDQYIGDASACADLPDVLPHDAGRINMVNLMASGAQRVDDVLAPMRKNYAASDTFAHAQVLSRVLQQIMRLSDYIQGQNPSSTETATAVDSIVSGNLSEAENIMQALKDTLYAPSVRKQLILYNFFKGHKENQVQYKSETITIDAGEVDLPWLADIDISTSIDRPAMVRRFVEAYATMIGDPFWEQYEIRRTLATVLQLPNKDKLLPPDDLLKKTIDDENSALMRGVALLVHPRENHAAHIEGHIMGLKWLQSIPPEQLAAGGLSDQEIIAHIQEHEDIASQLNSALGNTSKEMGGNAGNSVQPEAASRTRGRSATVPG